MKKNSIKIGILILLIFLPLICLAQVSQKVPIETYLPVTSPNLSPQYQQELVNVANLPGGDVPAVLTVIADILLGVTGSITMVALIYTGLLYVTAHGDDAQLEKAKNILKYIIAGLVIIAASYAIILGVSSLSFS
jgi:hypothetical protein